MKTILLYSGGLDSTVLLYKLVKDWGKDSVECLSFDYGQRHRRELLAAKSICDNLGITCHKVQLPQIWKNCSLVSGTPIPGGGDSDIIPNRNMILISIATAYAMERGARYVAWGVTQSDHETSPDCRFEFAQSMAKVMSVCHTSPVYLDAPFIGKTKSEVVTIGRELEVPFAATREGGHHAESVGLVSLGLRHSRRRT